MRLTKQYSYGLLKKCISCYQKKSIFMVKFA